MSVVEFDGRGEVAYDFGELDALALAYATTVHKSQGSEYAAVVLPLTTQHFLMLGRSKALKVCRSCTTAHRVCGS